MAGTGEEKTKLLLVDPHAENVRILREHLSAVGYEVHTCSAAGEALAKIAEIKPDLVLSEFVFPDTDGAELLDRIESDPRTARTPIIFLSKVGDAETKTRALNLGAKDFLAKPMHVKEVVARLAMVLARLRRGRQSASMQGGPSGRLEEMPLMDLLLEMAREGKSVVIRLTAPSGLTGQVIVRRGAVTSASTASTKHESALFEMLTWRQGRFSISYEEMESPEAMPLSTLGQLLEGARRLEEIQSLEKQLPSLDSPMVPTENFRQILTHREPSPEMKRFISLFDGTRTLRAVINESGYDLTTALQRIVKLYRQGFLRRVDQPEAEEMEAEEVFGPMALREPSIAALSAEAGVPSEVSATPVPSAEEHVQKEPEKPRITPAVQQPSPPRPPLARRAAARRGIIFIGSTRAGRRQIVRTLTQGNFRIRSLRSLGDISLDRGSALLDGTLQLEVFGLAPDPRFAALSRIVAFELSGCVIVVNGADEEQYDYYSYLISSLRQTLAPLPCVVAVTNVGMPPPSPDFLRRRLGLAPADPLFYCDPSDRESVRKVIEPLLQAPEGRAVRSRVATGEHVGTN